MVMMKQLNENFSEIFDVMPLEVPEEPPKQEVLPTLIEDHDDSIESDFSIARSNLRGLISKGENAIDGILKVAEESEHPRAYEVAATFLKTIGDLNKDLLELQKKRKDLTNKTNSNNNGQTNIDKAVFIGSTADLIKMIKNKEQ